MAIRIGTQKRHGRILIGVEGDEQVLGVSADDFEIFLLRVKAGFFDSFPNRVRRMQRDRLTPSRPADAGLMSTGELAQALHVSTPTVRRWCEEGLLPYIPDTRGKRFFRRAQLERQLGVVFAELGPLLSEIEVCERLHVVTPTLRRYVEGGMLSPIELPTGVWRFTAGQIEAVLVGAGGGAHS